MQARPNTPFFERSLIEAIQERNIKASLALIKNIEEYEGNHRPSLTTIDDQGINFLSHSLLSDLPTVTRALLDTDLFDEETAILFSVSPQDQSLVCLASEKGYEDIVERLLHLSSALLSTLPPDQQNTSIGYRIWHKKDALDNTPLHYAATRQNLKLIKLFTQLIKNEPDHAYLINQTNHSGNTALHILMQSAAPVSYIECVLECDADWNLANNLRKTPFGMLCQWNADHQIAFANALSNKNRISLIATYKRYLINHPNDDAIRSVYYKIIATKQSLKALAAAHLEIDPRVKIKNSFFVNAREDGFILKMMYDRIPSDEYIIRETANRQDYVYLYTENNLIKIAARDNHLGVQRIQIDGDLRSEIYLPIREALQDPNKQKSLSRQVIEALSEILLHYGYDLLIPPYHTTRVKKRIDATKVEDTELAKLIPNYLKRLSDSGVTGLTSKAVSTTTASEELFLQDRETLTALITDIENYLQDLSARKPWPIYKILSTLIPITTWLIYGGIETWLLVSAIDEYNHAYYDGVKRPIMFPKDRFMLSANETYYDGIWCEGSEGHGYRAFHYVNSTWDDGTIDVQATPLRQDCTHNNAYLWTALGFGSIGLLLNSLLSSFVPCLLWRKKPSENISHHEWSRHLETLQAEVTQKLESLQDNDLPVNPASINQLVDITSELASDKTKDEAIALFSRLSTILKNLRDELDRSHRPYSAQLFATKPDNREVVIDMSSESDSDTLYSDMDESIPLLKAPSI